MREYALPASIRKTERLAIHDVGENASFTANTVQCSVNISGIEVCVAVLRDGWNPSVNSATARFHGRSMVADSLAEGQTHRSLGQRPRTRDRPIIVGWLKANLTIANGMDFGEIQ